MRALDNTTSGLHLAETGVHLAEAAGRPHLTKQGDVELHRSVAQTTTSLSDDAGGMRIDSLRGRCFLRDFDALPQRKKSPGMGPG